MKQVLLYLFILAVTCWVIGFVVFVLYTFSFKYAQPKKADAIVVLTGGVDRLSTALDLLKEGYGQFMFVSGVKQGLCTADILPSMDPCFSDQIHLGFSAGNTHENARETYLWVRKNNIKSILLVTSFYHMPRSILEIKLLNPKIQIYAYPVFPKQIDVNWVHTKSAWLLFEEYHKVIVVYCRSLLRSLLL